MTGSTNARDMLFDPEIGLTNDKQVLELFPDYCKISEARECYGQIEGK